jgi:DNA repair exonuclease SbcCD nuclease subunit
MTFRRGGFDPFLPSLAAEYIKSLDVSHILISGDFTCTSAKKEFLVAQKFIQSLIEGGFTVYTIPGNHDAYTKSSCKNRYFYEYFDGLVNLSGYGGFNLVQDRVAAYLLTDDWYLICIDCAYYTSYIKSTGIFSEKLEKRLKELLSALPKAAKILLSSHFSLGEFKYPKAHLEREEKLKEIIDLDNRIKAYLHGHRHKQELFHMGKLLVADSGSIACQKTSSFNLLELSKEQCKIFTFRRKGKTWEENYHKETF